MSRRTDGEEEYVRSYMKEMRQRKKRKTKKKGAKENKVIRPKSRASALSKKVRWTDRQTFFFSKRQLK